VLLFARRAVAADLDARASLHYTGSIRPLLGFYSGNPLSAAPGMVRAEKLAMSLSYAIVIQAGAEVLSR
jgi:hypothetical protein